MSESSDTVAPGPSVTSAAGSSAGRSPEPASGPRASRRAGGLELDAHIIRLAIVVVLGTVMSILDTTIVNVAIDTLAKDFRAPLTTIQWVSTGYLLALSMVMPLTGWSVERFGAKRMWILSLVLFLGGSVLAGASSSADMLIVFRVVQGVGGGMIMPIGMSIMAQAAGPQRMGRVMSVLGVPMLLGPVLGPVIGGLIIDSVSWRWIFYVNVPIGIVAIILAMRILPSHKGGKAEPLDTLGLLLLSPGLAAVVYGLAEMGTNASGATIGISFAVGAVLLLAFVLHALRSRISPLIDVRLFRDRSFSAAAVTTFIFGAVLFGAMLLFPLYYQVDRGESALTAGLLMAPQGIGAALMMPPAGRLTDRLGAGRVVPIGAVVVMLGTIAYTQVGPDTAYWWLALSLFVRGLGFGFVMMPSMAAAYQTLRRDQVPRATTTINILQRVGGALGTALLAVVLQREIAAHVSRTAADLTAGQGTLPAALRAKVAAPLAQSFGSSFWWALAMSAMALVPAFLLPRLPRPVAADAMAGGVAADGAPGDRGQAVPEPAIIPEM